MENAIKPGKCRSRKIPLLSILIPCYNEEETLLHTLELVEDWLLRQINAGVVYADSFVFLVDDGSRDTTWSIISQPSQKVRRMGLRLAGNAGHQNALTAGMLEVADQVDCLITIDADLQDDLESMLPMIKAYTEGKEIVYGVRDNRDTDSPFKRCTAYGFYKVMQILGTPTIPQHADYRLVSKTALMALTQFPERNLFLRGIFPILNLPSSVVSYSRKERKYGVTKYPLRKMLSFAWQGITSFSSAPLRLAAILSSVTMLLAFLYGLLSFYKWLCGDTITGWTSIVLITLFLGSAQLFCISLLGEYIAKIFVEVKGRPRYLVAEKFGIPPQ